MDITSLLIQLVSGAVGGNIAGMGLKKYSLGTLGNSIAGILGGGIGAQILGPLLPRPRKASLAMSPAEPSAARC
jgi:uncharacterized membrane protein YeaQ/YmgE (transglycosylase-associated protein family)